MRRYSPTKLCDGAQMATSASELLYPCCLLWSPYGIGQTIMFLSCGFFFFFLSSFVFSSPNLSRRRLDVCHTSTYDVANGLSANFGCMSERCCTRLAENTGRKKVAKNRHLGTIAQFCRAISSQLRHVSTSGKNSLSSNMSSRCPPQDNETSAH